MRTQHTARASTTASPTGSFRAYVDKERQYQGGEVQSSRTMSAQAISAVTGALSRGGTPSDQANGVAR